MFLVQKSLLGDLKVFFYPIKKDEIFVKSDKICDLACLMVETIKNLSFILVYRILKLALVLLVVTATAERFFFQIEAYQDEFTQLNE